MRKLTTVVVALLPLSGHALAQEKLSPKTEPSHPPVFRIVAQPDSPLQVASAETGWALPNDESIFQIFIVVRNVSSVSIRAYSTCLDGGKQSEEPLCFSMNLMPGQIISPGKTDGRSSWQPPFSTAQPPTIWVDYVEFTDGRVWGADQGHFAEQLDGERSGARARREQFLKLLQAKGPDAVMEFIRENSRTDNRANRTDVPAIVIMPSRGHSQRWGAAFLRGASSILERVVRAEHEWGRPGIESSLRQPYDASEMSVH